uniref:trypsin n=1 Tax=Oryzias sinensis TaxID=183150 RepID=A0A8C7X1M9_9TELE
QQNQIFSSSLVNLCSGCWMLLGAQMDGCWMDAHTGQFLFSSLKLCAFQRVQVLKIVTHHQYNTRTKECDLALLKLEQSEDSFIPGLGAHESSLKNALLSDGPRVNRLQEVNVSILAFDVCNEYYKGRIMPSMFCAGKDQGGLDACQGDAGAPLFCRKHDSYFLFGVVTWGSWRCSANKPAIFTRVADFLSWIRDVIDV